MLLINERDEFSGPSSTNSASSRITSTTKSYNGEEEENVFCLMPSLGVSGREEGTHVRQNKLPLVGVAITINCDSVL